MIKRFSIGLDKYGSYGKYEVWYEHYPSLSALESGLQAKGPSQYTSGDDFLSTTPWDPEWSGFNDPEELATLLKGGVRDTSAVRKVAKIKSGMNKGGYVRKRVMDVVGDEVDIPTYLSGVPECMEAVYRKPAPRKAFRLVLDGSILGHVEGEDLTDAGIVLAKLVMSLEKGGRPVILTNFHAAIERDTDELMITTIDIRRPGTNLNPQKLLFATHPAFHRGAIFTWRARTMPHYCSMGKSLYSYIENHDDFVRFLKDNVFREKELYLLRVSDVVDLLPSKSIREKGWEDKVIKELTRRYL